MRLKCPNCGAEYAIDDGLIPESGRDVLCSACGHGWFQPQRREQPVAADPAAQADAPDTSPPAKSVVPESVAESPAVDVTSAEVSSQEDLQHDAARDGAAPDSAIQDDAAQEGLLRDDEDADRDAPAADGSEAGRRRRVEDPMRAALQAVVTPAAAVPSARPFAGAGSAAPPVEAEAGAPQARPHAPEPDAAEARPAPRPGTAPRPTLHDSLRALLREEAEREARARRAEGSSLETQPELGLAQAPAQPGMAAGQTAAAGHPVAKAALDSAAATSPNPADAESATAEEGTEDAAEKTQSKTEAVERVEAAPEDQRPPTREALPEAESDAVAPMARRELLPDIAGINSSLRATSERLDEPAARDAPETLARRRAGFRAGFLAAILLAAMATAVYAFAPHLAEGLPATAPVLDGYVSGVDNARLWLDDRIREINARLAD